MTSDIDLYWFSGTGNSLFIAIKTKGILDSLGYNCLLEPLEKINIIKNVSKNTIGLIIPVAMQGTYPIVWEFLNRLPEGEGKDIFLIDTLGMYSGGIKGPIKKIVKEKNYNPMGAIEIKMPNMFLRKEKKLRDEKNIANSIARLEEYCYKLHKAKTNWRDIPIYSDLMSDIFKTQEKGKKWVRKFKKSVTKECINCGICIQLCPRNCTDNNSKHINVDSDNCILCQRCLEYCPKNAIEINNKKYIKSGLISIFEFKKYLEDSI